MAINVVDDFTQVIADVSDILSVALVKVPTLNWLKFAGPQISGNEFGQFEWTERVREEETGTLSLTYTSASGLMKVTDSSIFLVNDIVYIEDHLDADDITPIFRVTAIPDGTTISVTLLNGTDTTFVLATPPQVIFRQNPIPDLATAGTGGIAEPVIKNNYLQMFQDDIEIGGKAQRLTDSGRVKGLPDALAEGFTDTIHAIARQIENAIWFGFPSAESKANARGSSMGGINFYVNTASNDNRINAGANPVTEDDLNSAMRQAYNNGLPLGDEVIMFVSPDNADVIGSLRTDKIRMVQEDDRIGQQISVFVPSAIGARPIQIITDHKQRNDKIFLLARDNVQLVSSVSSVQNPSTPAPPSPIDMPNGVAWVVDSTVPGTHGKLFTVRAELSIRVKQALRFHSVIHNIA